LRLAVTYSSPSAEAPAARLEPDYHGFVPYDLRGHTDAAVQALRPSVLVFARHDVWPNLVASAARAGVRTGLINATVRPGSTRLRQPGRALLRRAYRALDAVGAVSEADRARLESLGVRPEAIRVTGDASFDQAVARLSAAGERPLRLPGRPPGVVRLIAGSTWPDDEALLVEAVADLDAVELVLVPHEPTPATVERIRNACVARFGRSPRLFSELDTSGHTTSGPRAAPPPLIVDAVGFLAELYAEGDVGYVGGALAGAGLHSVIEPAAAGLPVLFGPRHDRWEAAELIEAGAAREVDPTSIYATLVSLLDPGRRRRMGQAALDYVSAHIGADRKGAELVLDLLDRGA
jgi:3-deoxy-D-manno-octulosonic-acid transferase